MAVDIKETQGVAPNYPMIGDTDLRISKLYGMLPAAASGDASARTPADNQTVRNMFVIGPDKKVKLLIVYPMTTGRISTSAAGDRLAATDRQTQGGDPRELEARRGRDHRRFGSDEEAKKIYPDGWEARRPICASCRSRAESRSRRETVKKNACST